MQELWRYRFFILGSVKRDFQIKYKNSLLGSLWSLINPIALIFVYTTIFSRIMQTRMDGMTSTASYSIFLCSGILTWGFFSETIGRSQSMFLENANLLKKVNFPRSCLPIIISTSAALNFLIVFGVFTLFLLVSGNFPGFTYLYILPLIIIQTAFSICFGVSLGILNVFFRDVGQSINVLLQFWYWLTPIVYPLKILPKSVQTLVLLNPMTGLVIAYQDVLVFGKSPDWIKLVPVGICILFFFYFGRYLYSKHSSDMVDEL